MLIPKFKKGEVLSADKLNRLADCVGELASGAGKMPHVSGGAGVLVSQGPGGIVVSLLNQAKGGKRGGTDSTSTGAAHPFKVSLVAADSGKQKLLVSGGTWHGRGKLPHYGIAAEKFGEDEDAFVIPDSEYTGELNAGTTFAVVLYAPVGDGGAITEAPACYFLKLEDGDDGSALRKAIRKFHYSTAAVVGAWKVARAGENDENSDNGDNDAGGTKTSAESETEKNDGGDDSDSSSKGTLVLKGAPGQILCSDFWHRDDNLFSGGKFGWRCVDGAENSFEVSDGFVLVRPNSCCWGGDSGDALKFSKEENKAEIEIPLRKYTFEANYPDAEIEFLKSVAYGTEGDGDAERVNVEVDIPVFSKTLTTTVQSLTYAVSNGSQNVSVSANSGTKQFLTSVKVGLDKVTTTVYAEPGGTGTYYAGILTRDTDANATTTLSAVSVSGSVSVPVVGSKTVSFNVVASGGGTTVREDTVTTTISIPVAKTLETTTGSFKPMIGGKLTEENDGTTTISVNIDSGVASKEESSAYSSELFPGGVPSPAFSKFYPALHRVNGETFSLSDEEIDAGCVVFLYVSVSGGNVPSCTWKVARAEDFPALGEKPQLLALSVQARVVETQESDNSTISAGKAFVVRAALDEGAFDSFASAFPMAVISRGGDGAPCVQPLVNGVLTVSPTLCIALNPDKSTARNEQGLSAGDLSPGGQTSLLSAKKLAAVGAKTDKDENGDSTETTATRAAAAMALAWIGAGAGPLFSEETPDIIEAASATD